MNNLKDIIGEMRETPSPRCWDSIASQLPAAGATAGAGAASAKAGTNTVAKIATTAGKTALSAGKIATIAISSISAVIIATAVTVASINHLSDTATASASEPQPVQTALAQLDTTATDTVLFDNTPADNLETAGSNSSAPKANSITHTPSRQDNPAQSVAPTNTPAANHTATAPADYLIKTNTATAPQQEMPTQQTASHSSSNNVVSDKNGAALHPENSHLSTQTAQISSESEKAISEDADDDFGFSPAVKIIIPNIFTPNGDGVNDLFIIEGIDHCEKRVLIIKDRNGHTVFQSQQYENNWDASNLPDGQYYYYFNYTINNINEMRRGTLYIRR